MGKDQLQRKYSVFLGVILSGYNVADKLYGAVFIILLSLRGVDAFQISIVFAVSSLSMAIFDYPSGNLSDIYGRKRMTAAGFIVWGAGLGIFAAADGLALFIAASIVMSLGVAMISGSPQAWYIDQLEELGMPDYKKIALPRISGFVSAFAVVGALLGTVSSNIHYYLPVAIAGVLAVGFVYIPGSASPITTGAERRAVSSKRFTPVLLISPAAQKCGLFFCAAFSPIPQCWLFCCPGRYTR